MPVGYSGTPLVKKLGFKAGMRVLIINPPSHYFELLEGLPDNLGIAGHPADGPFDLIHFFTTERLELEMRFDDLKSRMARDGMLWVSWPKGRSKITKDLNENDVRAVALGGGLVDVKVCAVDADWSGLKLMYRVKDR